MCNFLQSVRPHNNLLDSWVRDSNVVFWCLDQKVIIEECQLLFPPEWNINLIFMLELEGENVHRRSESHSSPGWKEHELADNTLRSVQRAARRCGYLCCCIEFLGLVNDAYQSLHNVWSDAGKFVQGCDQSITRGQPCDCLSYFVKPVATLLHHLSIQWLCDNDTILNMLLAEAVWNSYYKFNFSNRKQRGPHAQQVQSACGWSSPSTWRSQWSVKDKLCRKIEPSRRTSRQFLAYYQIFLEGRGASSLMKF